VEQKQDDFRIDLRAEFKLDNPMTADERRRMLIEARAELVQAEEIMTRLITQRRPGDKGLCDKVLEAKHFTQKARHRLAVLAKDDGDPYGYDELVLG
jgi:hypothetical protein